MENDRYYKLYDINNNLYCLINQRIEFYKDNIWQYLNIGLGKKETQDLFLNFFDYKDINIFRPLQYFYQDKFKELKEEDYVIYYNTKFHNRTNYINLILNSLTFYLINYEGDKFGMFVNIIKNNIIYSTLRKFDKHKDYSLKYKSINNKETLDKIYFKKQLLKDLLKLKINISFKFKNINCNPNIKNLLIFKNIFLYSLENNDIIKLSLDNNKLISINSIKLKENYNLNSKLYINDNNIYDFNGSIFIENIIIDFNFDPNISYDDLIDKGDKINIKDIKDEKEEKEEIDYKDDLALTKNKIDKNKKTNKSLDLTELLSVIITNKNLKYDDDDINDYDDNDDDNYINKKEKLSKDTIKHNQKYSDTSYEIDEDDKTNDDIDINLYNEDNNDDEDENNDENDE